jgi:hypothetical protein
MDPAHPYAPPAPDGGPRITIGDDRIRIIAEMSHADQAAAFSELMQLRGIARKAMLVIKAIAVPLVIVVVIATAKNRQPGPDRGPPLSLFIAVFAVVLTVVFVIRFGFRRQREDMKRNPFNGTCTFDLGPEDLVMHGEVHRTQVAWRQVKAVAVTPTALWLLYNSYAGYWIPRGAIGGQDNLEAVLAFIRARNPATTIERSAKNSDHHRAWSAGADTPRPTRPDR